MTRASRVGVVVSDKMQKTVVVAVKVERRDPAYGKLIRLTRKYKAHDEGRQCKVGDQVRILQTRPLSRDKRWRVAEILSRKGEVRAIPVAEEAKEE